jgi:hypothetical protein
MYDVQTLLGSSSEYAQLPGARAYNYTSGNGIECGKVIEIKHTSPSITSVGIP